MRSKIEPSEYKDFILGFIFYKFLCEQEIAYLRSQRWDDEDIVSLSEEDTMDVDQIKKNKGYFISYENLYSTWLNKKDFNIANVRDALSAFERNIHSDYKKVFDGVFDELTTNLSKLGDNAAAQTKAVADILELIDPIPMDGKQGYDVLGFIYEYLLMQFATNSGKKAGQFYTPHEVAMLMSDIVASHLKERETIGIYDPTSGSASLLLAIGQSVARKNGDPNSIHYYAQELIGSTYNLTRMNLVMRGVQPANIDTRNDDTLGDDWPLEDDSDMPLQVDACVSNPPYSQHWTYPIGSDPRFADYGLAPKSKADYAFLLHNLYHLDRNGIMCIVLPHGVLFRGGEEGKIREKLLKDGNIDAVIGLPANIFYGTGIPTIVMVVKKVRECDDVLFIDASKGFVKEGKKNRLRARDIRRIVDAYEERANIEGFAHLATLDEIESNEFNLNIPRYVCSDDGENYSLHATLYGGVPSNELDEYMDYWEVLSGLREELFEEQGGYGALRVDDISQAICDNQTIGSWRREFDLAFDGLKEEMEVSLLGNVLANDEQALHTDLSTKVLERSKQVPLLDEYKAYQLFDDHWQVVSADIEALHAGGMDALRAVDPNMKFKETDGKEKEVQDKKEPWIGRVLPFELVQRHAFEADLSALSDLKKKIASNEAELESLLQEIPEDEKQGGFCDESGENWVFGVLGDAIDKELEATREEYSILKIYLTFLDKKPKKEEKINFVDSHKRVAWNEIVANKDGTYGKSKVEAYLKELRTAEPDGTEGLTAILIRANRLNEDNKSISKQIKEKERALIAGTKEHIESIDEAEAMSLLREKWVDVFLDELMGLPELIAGEFGKELERLVSKYNAPLYDVEEEIRVEQIAFVELLRQLDGSESDLEDISGLLGLLGGE